MSNVWNAFEGALNSLNTPIGFAGSLITIYDHFKNQNKTHLQEILQAIREKSEVAYERYCQNRIYRKNDLGTPLKEDILGYWELCLRRDVLPSVEHMVTSGIACLEEAKVIMPYLMEQWMTVPTFSEWLHGILIQNHLQQIAEKIADIPWIAETMTQIKTQMDLHGINRIATLLSPAYINDAKYSCNDEDIKNFFAVNDNLHTMLRVISAGEDVPNPQAEQALMEMLQSASPAPVIIAGNGGQGKTSLMMCAAVQWASEGRLVVWMKLANQALITEQEAHCFFDFLLQTASAGQRILLCIDNPYEGRESFSNLQVRWPRNTPIQLLLAERENRLTLLADPDQDLLLHWFDASHLIVLQGINQAKQYRLKDYTPRYFTEDLERRRSILKKCTSYFVKEGTINADDQKSVIERILKSYQNPNISLVELIYRTLFELKKISSKTGSIKLDWEEWGEMIRREFRIDESSLQLYGVIAALKIFNIPMTLSLFCKRFELNKRKLRARLCERFVSRHVEPVVYREESETLQTKHDVIAELFFLFHRGQISIHSLIEDLIEVMDEDEIELFLSNIVNKREILKGKKYPIGEITYWRYMEAIYHRIQKGPCKLSREARAYLCLGFLWARKQRGADSPTIQSILDNLAPEIENDLLLAKLYTEWGIWAANEKRLAFAEKKLLAVIELNPKQLPARTELGRLLSKQKGREDQAEKFLLEAIKIDPQQIAPRTELGRLLSKQKGREDQAEKFLLEAIKIDPNSLHSRTVLARLYESMNRLPEAKQLYHELCVIDPGNRYGIEGLSRLERGAFSKDSASGNRDI